jgi:small-conductance mechanosensitive channel
MLAHVAAPHSMTTWFVSLADAYATWFVSLAIVAYLILLLWIATGWPEGDVPARTYYLYLHRVVSIIALFLFGPVGLIFAWYAFGPLAMVLKALWTGVFERPDFLGDTGDVTILRSEQPGNFWDNVTFYAVIAVLLLSFSLAFFYPLVTYLRRVLRKPPN